MERHVSSYRIHLNVCVLETRPAKLTELSLLLLHRKSQTIFRISSPKIGDCKSRLRISVRSWPRSQTYWYALPDAPFGVANCFWYTRKLLMLIESLLSSSLRSRWRSRKVSRNSRRLQRICTRHYRLDGTEVCGNPDAWWIFFSRYFFQTWPPEWSDSQSTGHTTLSSASVFSTTCLSCSLLRYFTLLSTSTLGADVLPP